MAKQLIILLYSEACIIEFRSVNRRKRISWGETSNVIGLMLLSAAFCSLTGHFACFGRPPVHGFQRRATFSDRTCDLCDTKFLMTTWLKVLCWVQIISRSSSSWSLQVRRIMINRSVCLLLPSISSPVKLISSHSDDSVKTPDLYVTVSALCFLNQTGETCDLILTLKYSISKDLMLFTVNMK